MPRLIDADLAIEKCNEDMEAVKDLPQRQDGILDAVMNIHECPTIDAVPVVRCKDCKYWNPTYRYCEGIGNWFGEVDSWSDNGFCFKGERRTYE